MVEGVSPLSLWHPQSHPPSALALEACEKVGIDRI